MPIFARAFSFSLVALLLVHGSASAQGALGEDAPAAPAPKRAFDAITYVQKIRDPNLGMGTMTVTVTPDGTVKQHYEGLTMSPVPGHPEVTPLGTSGNGEYTFKLTPEELATFDDTLAKTDFTKGPDTSTPTDVLGPFQLTVTRDGKAQPMGGSISEYLGVRRLLRQMANIPADRIDPAKDLEKGSIALEVSGPMGADGTKPWCLSMTVAPDGAVVGSYQNLDGTPSGKPSATFKGTLSKEELAALRASLQGADFAQLPKADSPASPRIDFQLRTSTGDQSRWVSGALADYEAFRPIVKQLATAAEKLDAPKASQTPGANGAFDKASAALGR